jgi:hypothetical protein
LGLPNLTSRQEHSHDRQGYQPVAPAHDRGHDDPQARAEDPSVHHPCRQELYAVYEPGFARHGAALAACYPGLPQPVYRVMPSDGFTFVFPPRAYALDAYAALRAEVGPSTPWMIAGLAVDVLPLVAQALARGFHVRVGLEDPPLGSVRTNLDLVEEAARLIRASGRDLATPDDVRAGLAGAWRG